MKLGLGIFWCILYVNDVESRALFLCVCVCVVSFNVKGELHSALNLEEILKYLGISENKTACSDK